MLCPPDLSPPPSRQSVLTGCRHSMQMGIVVAFRQKPRERGRGSVGIRNGVSGRVR
jgi:hypothetical protein